MEKYFVYLEPEYCIHTSTQPFQAFAYTIRLILMIIIKDSLNKTVHEFNNIICQKCAWFNFSHGIANGTGMKFQIMMLKCCAKIEWIPKFGVVYMNQCSMNSKLIMPNNFGHQASTPRHQRWQFVKSSSNGEILRWGLGRNLECMDWAGCKATRYTWVPRPVTGCTNTHTDTHHNVCVSLSTI